MKAAQINEYGDAKVIKVVEVDKPTLKAGQILVEVHASSLNPFDSTVRSGYMKEAIPLRLPVTLGGDIAGVVTEVGEGVVGTRIGDKVYGQASAVARNSGALAEYAATAASQVAVAPSTLSFQEAASLPLVASSAWQALTRHIGLKSGQKILITGGGGNIGRIAIQLAKHLGAYVVATATGEDIDAATSLGADEVIDYKSQDFTEILSGLDAAFDTAGGEQPNKVLSVLKAGGIAVSVAGQFDEAKVDELHVTAISQMSKVTTEALNEIRQLVDAGVIKPSIGKTFKLDDIQTAFEARESGTVSGKIVIEIR